MPYEDRWPLSQPDARILRSLLEKKRDLANMPIMAERKALWLRHASLDSQRPMILAETGGVLDELLPVSDLRCQADWARQMERELRETIYRCEQVADDWVVEPRTTIPWDVSIGDYGVETVLVRGNNSGKLGSYHWDPPLRLVDSDLDRLHFRALSVNRELTLARKAFLEANFGDILPVQIRANYWWTNGLTWQAINLVGMEPLMLAMMDNPRAVHRLMAFLRDDCLNLLDWFERENLLTLNNEDDYVGSGSIGYTSELPVSTDGRVRVSDLWGLSESQETVGVSPKMFGEFIFPYQLPVISRFGLSYYGCCEPVNSRIRFLKQIPNLRRLSVSPWADQERMAAELGRKFIFCRKPNPALISTPVWDEEAILEDLRATVQTARGCPLELVMKDVHTLSDQAWRLGRWVELARLACEQVVGQPG